jgi:hypothetical protein
VVYCSRADTDVRRRVLVSSILLGGFVMGCVGADGWVEDPDDDVRESLDDGFDEWYYRERWLDEQADAMYDYAQEDSL